MKWTPRADDVEGTEIPWKAPRCWRRLAIAAGQAGQTLKESGTSREDVDRPTGSVPGHRVTTPGARRPDLFGCQADAEGVVLNP